MGKGRRYDQEYKDMIVDLFKSGISLTELSSEYGIARSTINGWIKDIKEIKIDENEVMTLKEVKELKKEMARIRREMKYYTKGGQSQKSYGHICNKKLDEVIEFIDSNKSNHDVKTMCTVLGIAGSTYYKYFNKTKSERELENEKLEVALKNAYYSQSPDKNKKLIFHSDLGSQYTSNDLKKLCKKFNITQSFSKKGCPYDNAGIESFHSSIKKEEIYRNTYRTFEEANRAVFKYIEGWYNRKRLHSSINYMTPDQCELLARSTA